MRDAATALVARAWDAHGQSGEDLDYWSPWISTPSLDGVLQFGHFGFDFTQRWRNIDAQLGGTVRERWLLLLAADAVLHRDPEPEQVELLRTTRSNGLPWWISRAIYKAHVTHAEDPAGAGAVLAQLAERADLPLTSFESSLFVAGHEASHINGNPNREAEADWYGIDAVSRYRSDGGAQCADQAN